MPLYEYKCQNCEKEFEDLVRGDETPVCPFCNSSAVERKISLCACHAKSGNGADYSLASSSASSGCAGCSGGHCSSCSR